MENLIATDKTPLGAKYNESTKCVEFKLYSKNATKVLLCIFDNLYILCNLLLFQKLQLY